MNGKKHWDHDIPQLVRDPDHHVDIIIRDRGIGHGMVYHAPIRMPRVFVLVHRHGDRAESDRARCIQESERFLGKNADHTVQIVRVRYWFNRHDISTDRRQRGVLHDGLPFHHRGFTIRDDRVHHGRHHGLAIKYIHPW